METDDRVKDFKSLLNQIRRSYRDHGHRLAEPVNVIELRVVTTIDIISSRPAYVVDPLLFPITIILGPGAGFLTNFNNAAIGGTGPCPAPLDGPGIARAEIEAAVAMIDKEMDDDGEADAAITSIVRGTRLRE